jgi:hypothetical protein
MSQWAVGFVKCISCGIAVNKHRARGLCASCYNAASEVRTKSHITRRRGESLPTQIAAEDLINKYQSGLSLADIARQYNCTRQFIHKLMRRYKIVRRTKSEARGLALNQGKIFYTSKVYSPGKTIRHEKRHVNATFFKTWTPAMAYVLGVICTDGCLAKPIGPIKFRITLSQKDPELLEKVRALMGSNASITYRPAHGIAGALHTMLIDSQEIYRDLQSLGLTQNKSLTLRFPNVPFEFVRHFIRGCWDGDGSVYLESKDAHKRCASFVCGSELFIQELLRHLVLLGLPHRTIHRSMRSKNPSFYFRYTGSACAQLCDVLYEGVDEGMYLARKYVLFKAIEEDQRSSRVEA